MSANLVALPLLLLAIAPAASEESQFSINHNKAVQLVDERFISFSVDPAVFFARLPHRDVLFKLIAHLSPAYLRVAGASTQFLDFDADERKATRLISDASVALTFSPAMWWSLNEWMQKTNFTPIFGVNDASDERWDAQRVLPLLDMTARMNVNCWWQIGFDCSRKGFERYKEDLKSFRKLVDAFPSKKDKWHILGSDLSRCTPSDHSEILRMYLADLDDADAIMWEEDESIVSNFLSSGVMETLLGFHQATLPIWLSTPKIDHPVNFDDGINWAVEIGEAARKGFAIVFKEPRLQEYYTATPAYWVTVLHKSLMGRNVLDVKQSSFSHSDARIYAHCARDQNSFSVRGAICIMIVNNGTQDHKAAFRVPAQLKSVEVRSYVLTTSDNSMDTYLNKEKLALDTFKLSPKLRRAKVLSHLTLAAPAKSIVFFVLPGAKIPICVDSEDDTALILQEIDRIQAVDFADGGAGVEGLLSRLNAPPRASASLADLHRKLQEEIKTDAAAVPKLKLKSQVSPGDEWKQLAQRRTAITDGALPALKNLNFFLDKAKADVQNVKPLDFKNLLKKDNERKDDILGMSLITNTLSEPPKQYKKEQEEKPAFDKFEKFEKPKSNPFDLDLNLSSGEVFKILGDRAKAKLERKMGFTDFEFDLDSMLDKALRGKFKRDINLKLLEEKVHDQETNGKIPKLVKKMKIKEKKLSSSEEEGTDVEKLPDMSKIIPGFEKKPKATSPTSEGSIFGGKTFPKLELFKGEKLDLQSLLSLLGSKTPKEVDGVRDGSDKRTRMTTTERTFLMKPEIYDDHDFDRQFQDLEDDLSSGSFYEHFGDSISLSQTNGQDQRAGDGRSEWMDFDDVFRDKEFIVNDEDVPGAIKRLEDYFNRRPSTSRMSDGHFEPAFDSFDSFDDLRRYKRGIRDFIHRMRQGKSPSYFLRNNPFYSRQRSRRSRETPNKLVEEYRPKMKRKEWKPEDVLKLPMLHTSYSVDERPDQISFEDIPKSSDSKLGLAHAERINIRKARKVDGDIDSVENAIDSLFEVMEKDTKLIRPLLEGEEGEYTFVLPSSEKLSLSRGSNGDTQIVLRRDGGGAKIAPEAAGSVEDSTCPATDLYPGLLPSISARLGNVAIERVKVMPEKRSEYIQKIPAKPRKNQGQGDAKDEPLKLDALNKYNLGFVNNIVSSFSAFMKKLHNKMDTFFNAVE